MRLMHPFLLLFSLRAIDYREAHKQEAEESDRRSDHNPAGREYIGIESLLCGTGAEHEQKSHYNRQGGYAHKLEIELHQREFRRLFDLDTTVFTAIDRGGVIFLCCHCINFSLPEHLIVAQTQISVSRHN